MRETLDTYIRQRARELGLSATELCQRADISRQTLHTLGRATDKLPSLQTVVALADALRVHPLRLLHLIFDGLPPRSSSPAVRRRQGDQSAFLRDVTYPDGTLVLPGERFVKTWEMQNVGRVPWEGRYLQCQDDEIVVSTRHGEQLHLAANLLPEATRVPVPFTPPGATVQISVTFTAPEPPGTVLSYWKAVFEDGSFCFPHSRGLWVKVRVNSLVLAAYEDR